MICDNRVTGNKNISYYIVVKHSGNRNVDTPNKTSQTANVIRTTLQNLLPYLQILIDKKIVSVNFSQTYTYNTQLAVGTVSQVIEHCYDQIKRMGYKFGPTATSKLLHILQPELFVMWDKEIMKEYMIRNHQVSANGQGYCTYLKLMQQIAHQISIEFQKANLNPPRQQNQDPAVYLSTQMNYNPPKTLAKYLDEFNWVTITNKVVVPPNWHP